MSTTRWTVDEERVVAEILDDEVVVIDLVSGRYHATTGVGTTVWTAISAPGGSRLADIVEAVRAAHSSVPADADATIEAFLRTISEAGLVAERAVTTDAGAEAAVSHPAARTPWAPPTLESHDDLQDLLLLDPVHDVSDLGWPHAGPPPSP